MSRNIPQGVKLKVFRRDNCVCQICGKNVALDEINYDHIIPWSKGGSSDESNIRILCESCNKKRSNNFEEEYLIAHMKEAFHEPIEINLEMLKDLLRLFLLMLEIKSEGIDVSGEEYCLIIKSDDIETDHFMCNLIFSIETLLTNEQIFVKYTIQVEMLRYRWGIKDGQIHSIKETCNKFNKGIDYYVQVEMLLLRQLGFILEKKYRASEDYYDMVITLDDYKY
ncbi:HNH endonuclease [Clostridium perfringens]|nr:HNH endonuclease [Clostridium perfringens]